MCKLAPTKFYYIIGVVISNISTESDSQLKIECLEKSLSNSFLGNATFSYSAAFFPVNKPFSCLMDCLHLVCGASSSSSSSSGSARFLASVFISSSFSRCRLSLHAQGASRYQLC
jgi:hypothetical protein